MQHSGNEKLIHRDIKPENILLGRRNEVLLGDFVIAVLTRSVRSQSLEEVVGTAAYMAPEQLQGRSCRASDQYALGIVVYEWLSGYVPFHGSFLQVANQHLFAPIPPLSKKVLMLPLTIEQIVMKALAKDPKDRFVSVQEFAQEQWFIKGSTHQSTRQYREAITAYSFAIELDPAYAWAYGRRGQAYAALKEYQRAVEDFDRALKLDSRLAWVKADREHAYRQLKRK